MMRTREMHQYGWRIGTVECRCSNCDWSAVFMASDESVPEQIRAAFDAHSCDHGALRQDEPSRGIVRR
jgi:hypothetical protein